MGYTIAAHAKNAKLQKAMLAFMEEHYRKPHEVFGGEHDYSRLDIGKDLSYDNHPRAIGFDFNACEPERDYIIDVTRWMALKVGKPVKVNMLPRKVPCTYYDGGENDEDRWPVLVRDEWKKEVSEKWDWCLANKLGHKPVARKFKGTPLWDSLDAEGRKKHMKEHSRYMKEFSGYSFEELDRILVKELKRLEKAWAART